MKSVNLFKNVGASIKRLARILWIAGIVSAVVLGVGCFLTCVVFALSESGIFFLVALIAPPIVALGELMTAWIAAIMVYGYGEIIDKLCEIERNTAKTEVQKQEHEKAEKKKAEAERIERERKEREMEAQRVERERLAEEEARRNAELAQQQKNEEREQQLKNAPEIKVNSHCEGLCPKCGKAVAFERNFGYDKCKHCNTLLKITK